MDALVRSHFKTQRLFVKLLILKDCTSRVLPSTNFHIVFYRELGVEQLHFKNSGTAGPANSKASPHSSAGRLIAQDRSATPPLVHSRTSPLPCENENLA